MDYGPRVELRQGLRLMLERDPRFRETVTDEAEA
jgi:hypothetical protein